MAKVSGGAIGEVWAARFLRDKGYRILGANYRCRLGEIDIIAADGDYIVFVEVKTRSEDSLYTPREAVTAEKQQKLLKTAALFLKSNRSKLQPRFDVVEVFTKKNDPLHIESIDHIQNAFEAGDLHAAF